MTTRMTRALVESKIELVQAAAAREGITTVTYGGGTIDSLHLYGAYDTWALHARLNDGSTGISEVSTVRGLREIAAFLDGMYVAIDSIRHTRMHSA